MWIKVQRDNNFGRLVQFGVCNGGTKSFLPGPPDAFHSYFNGNEEYEWRFYSSSYNSNLGSSYWQQFEEMASAKKSSIASGPSNNTNAGKPSENCCEIMENHGVCSVEKNQRRINSHMKSVKTEILDLVTCMFQAVTFWLKHVGQMRPNVYSPKIGSK